MINQKIDKRDIRFKGKDGREYPTGEALQMANEAYKRGHLRYIVFGTDLGRREIAPGTGEVRICAGYFIEEDKITGRKINIPLYRTETF